MPNLLAVKPAANKLKKVQKYESLAKLLIDWALNLALASKVFPTGIKARFVPHRLGLIWWIDPWGCSILVELILA
jgi:hypothetical protein